MLKMSCVVKFVNPYRFRAPDLRALRGLFLRPQGAANLELSLDQLLLRQAEGSMA